MRICIIDVFFRCQFIQKSASLLYGISLKTRILDIYALYYTPYVFVGSTPFSHTFIHPPTHTHTQYVYISEIIVTKTVSRRRPVYNIFASLRLSGAVASPNGIQTDFDTTIIIFSRARWDIYTMRCDEMHRRQSTTSNDAFFEYFYSFAFVSFSVFPQTCGHRVELPVYSSVVVAIFYYYILCTYELC